MNLLDYFIIILMAGFAIRGIFRGFIRELASLIGVILGIIVGYFLEPKLSLILKAYLADMPSLHLISFAVLFFMSIVFCNCLAWLFMHLSKKEVKGSGDRASGSILALLKGLVVTFLFIVLLTFYVPSQAPLVSKSKMAPYIIKSYQSIVGVFSRQALQNWKQKVENTQKKITQTVTDTVQEIKPKNGK
jgi:membrane protein required for colicin V production